LIRTHWKEALGAKNLAGQKANGHGMFRGDGSHWGEIGRRREDAHGWGILGSFGLKSYVSIASASQVEKKKMCFEGRKQRGVIEGGGEYSLARLAEPSRRKRWVAGGKKYQYAGGLDTRARSVVGRKKGEIG